MNNRSGGKRGERSGFECNLGGFFGERSEPLTVDGLTVSIKVCDGAVYLLLLAHQTRIFLCCLFSIFSFSLGLPEVKVGVVIR